MINGLHIPYKQIANGLQLKGSGLTLPGTTLKGQGCNNECNTKKKQSGRG